MILNVNHDALRSGDRVICGGKGPVAMVTKLFTAGFKNIFNRSIAAHTGMIIEFKDQKLVVEMEPKGLVINSIKKYTDTKDKRYILDITRSSVLDNEATREHFETLIALYLRRTLDYDFRGLLGFVYSKIKDDSKKCYCSEFDYQITKLLGCKYPKRFVVRVSPRDLQKDTNWTSVPSWKI